MALVSNHLPRLSTDDTAIWNRIRNLYFDSYFPKDDSIVPKTWEEQLEKKTFHRDNDFDQKLPFMKQAFMWILVHILILKMY